MKKYSENEFKTVTFTRSKIVTIDPQVLSDKRIVMALHNDLRANYFRVLRTNILKQLRENNWNSFFVTSATPGAGKSFVSINLAIAMAREGNQSVLLVDADLRRPSIAETLKLACQHGLVDYLAGLTSLEDIIINPGIENLVVIPGKVSKQNYSELIASPKMEAFVKDVKYRYNSRVVIFDIPPIFVADDALLFMSYCDAGLFVIEDEKNTADELRHSLSILEETNLLGIVLNKSKRTIPSHKYGYGYGY